MPDLSLSVDLVLLLVILVLGLAFDFINGFHDAANSIATVVSTRVLSPRAAVVWAAAFNFIAFKVFETRVAGSIAKGVDPAKITEADAKKILAEAPAKKRGFRRKRVTQAKK